MKTTAEDGKFDVKQLVNVWNEENRFFSMSTRLLHFRAPEVDKSKGQKDGFLDVFDI